jgi:hypothetical protein
MERSAGMTKRRRPRTFAELVAAIDPVTRERIKRAEVYRDPTVENEFHGDVILQEDLNGNGWLVCYQDDDGAIYQTVFSGPKAEQRARDYFGALKGGSIKTIRAGASSH